MSAHGLHFVDIATGKETLLLVQLDIQSLEYSPCDNFVVCCEKYSVQNPQPNLFVICTKTGKTFAKFEWRKNPKEAMKSIRFSIDEKFCFRLAPGLSAKDVNSIEVYRDNDFTKPTCVIWSRFPVKALKKGLPATFVDGRFDGFDLCPLNPANPEKSPFYLFAWQHAAQMSIDDHDNGTVYVFDVNGSVDKSKFMISCARGQEISTKIPSTGHAALIWSQNHNDTSGKSYYGEHSLQYV